MHLLYLSMFCWYLFMRMRKLFFLCINILLEFVWGLKICQTLQGMNLILFIVVDILWACWMRECYFVVAIRAMAVCTIYIITSWVHRVHYKLIIVYFSWMYLLGEILFVFEVRILELLVAAGSRGSCRWNLLVSICTFIETLSNFTIIIRIYNQTSII